MTHGLESNYVVKGKTFLFSLNIIHEQQFTLYIYTECCILETS